MIGVQTKPDEREIAAEFFELFKTPWELARNGQRYDVLICTHDDTGDAEAGLVLRYGDRHGPFDAANNLRVKHCDGGAAFLFAERRVPLYGNVSVFPRGPFSLPMDGDEQSSVVCVTRTNQQVSVRLGYNLFDEVRRLLTTGQPVTNAATPTLDLHIAVLREVITRSGLSLSEIPPVPEGHAFIACLTHDVDHPALRSHFLDHTMFGFLHRATVGSVVDVYRGRKSLGALCRNLYAVCRLPFVYLGLANDPWRGFDRYQQIEFGANSTFFVIPRKGDAGRQRSGSAPGKRAAGYSLDDIRPELERITSTGGEVALHGLDAWIDASNGTRERDILMRANGAARVGVRMHWLYFDEQSPKALDEVGFLYDSTVGYNETVGFRAGTAQVYRLPGAAQLLELPLHLMDTALFYPSYLNLGDDEATKRVQQILNDVALFGGALTLNWHDRSIAPERLWDRFYFDLVRELKRRAAWMPTASKAVSWFEKRRSVKFVYVRQDGGALTYRASANADSATPRLVIRIHRPQRQSLFEKMSETISRNYQDSVFQTDAETTVVLTA